MEDPIDLQKVERRVMATMHQDGLMDLGIGLGTMIIGYAMHTHRTIYFVILPILLAMFIRGMRRRFTYPRIGFAKLKSPSLTPVKVIVFSSIIVISVVLAMVRRLPRSAPIKISSSGQWLFYSYFIALIVLTLAIMLAYRLKAFRIFGYVVLALGCWVHSRFAPIPLPFYVMVVGLVAMITGSVLFVKFLRSHPIPAAGQVDG
jgi:hypothetical protein